MKKLGRYIKWLFSSMGRFEWYMASMSFFLGGGITAIILDDRQLANIMFGTTLALSAVGLLYFMYKGFCFSWAQFREDDEQAWNILKKDKIK